MGRNPGCSVYAAQFSKHDNGKTFVIGGKGGDEAHFYRTATFSKFAELTNFSRAVYSVDYFEQQHKLAIGIGNGEI